MNSDVIFKLDEIINIIENSDSIKRIRFLKKDILEERELIRKISLIKGDNYSYGNSYINLKKEIISNPIFKEFKDIENDLYFLIQEINMKLNSLLKENIDENN